MLREALKAGPVWATGTMSGTSLDGVDAAMVLTDGAQIFAFGESRYRPYTAPERAVLRDALGRWDDLARASAVVENAHAELLSDMPPPVLVGFHGQTTAHDPRGRGTRQIGDGRILAHVLDCPVAWDFRRADVEAGGQGAPLAPFFHHACARYIGERAPVVFLNLGGVGNLTWVDPEIEHPAEPGACLAFDTGPANAPLNDLVRARLGHEHDAGGALAASGRPDAAVLEELARQPYFQKPPPKSLDRDAFAWLQGRVARLSDADAAATLAAACVRSVALGMAHCPAPPGRIVVCGGGRLNPVLMDGLGDELAMPVLPADAVGLDGDMIEAQAFAYLAVRVARGWPTSAPSTTGVPAPVGGGIVSRPGDLVDAVAAG